MFSDISIFYTILYNASNDNFKHFTEIEVNEKIQKKELILAGFHYVIDLIRISEICNFWLYVTCATFSARNSYVNKRA